MGKKNSSSAKKTIKWDELDPNFKFEVAEEPGGKNIKSCFACGTCTVICPVFSVNEKYNPRKIIRMILLGLKEEVLSNDFIWLCSGCYSCYELCPRDVKITQLMAAVRNIAIKEGYVPPAMKQIVNLIEKHGRILEVSEFENIIRTKKGISELEFKIDEIKKILKKTGIQNLIEISDVDE